MKLTQPLISVCLFILLTVLRNIQGAYVPPGPQYACPKEKLLLHPCSCDIESDQGIYVSCNNTNLASMSLALNNLATFQLPIERLTLNTCHVARLFGSLLYKLKLRILRIEDTPLEAVEDFTFLGVNNSLNELHIVNSSLAEFPTEAFKILGNLTILNIDGHNLTELPKNAFVDSDMTGKLLRLHIVNGKLNTPPIEALQHLRKLKTLDLHGNQLKDLKRNQFKGLRDVEVLDLSFNNLTKIDGTHLGDLTKMSWLNISHNSITELTRGAFARNTVLRVLNMSSNKIKKLDSNSFRGMRFLRRLFLADNLLTDVGRGTFSALQRIGTIDLARNFLKKIDYQMFFQLNFAELVDVSENNVTEVQKLAFKDLYLTTINLSKNNISKIESGAFENCANMTKLDLSFNSLKTLPKKAFDETTYATELQFSYNYFTSFDQIPLHNMTGLKILNVSHNLIENVPKKTFPKLYELHTIDISYNNLSDIFNAVFQTLFSLRTLDLSHNSMTSIKPSTFGPLPTLLKLDMSYNQLENIAKSAFTRLASTRELILHHNNISSLFILPISTSHLDLSHNNFEELPSKLWPSMNSLLNLDLSFNNLGDSLEPGSFMNLLTLQRLNLSYNGMTQPPWAAISEMTSLQYLYMQGNNLTKLNRNAFGKMPVMFELDLSDNSIDNVTAKAFEGLLQLIKLKLSRNDITAIPNGAFQGLVALTDLDLSGNRLVKLDNKTNGVFEECLSLERLNLSHNKITFITRKMFPSNPYYPYKLNVIDLSYNSIPVITHDLTFGTGKLEVLNMSHNAIADIRKSVIGNLTRLRTLDLSYNKLHDITSDVEFFRLPKNVSTLFLAMNELTELPWNHIKNVSKMDYLDVSNNQLQNIVPEMTEMIIKGAKVNFEGNPLYCDCFLRPLLRHFKSQLTLDPVFKTVKCVSPPYLDSKNFYEISEEQLTCPSNVNTTRLLDSLEGDFGVLSDLKFRELSIKKNILRVKWRILKHDDIADTAVYIRQSNNSVNIPFQASLPYFQRVLEIDVKNKSKINLDSGTDYEICVLAKTSRNFLRKFYPDQCRNLKDTLNGGSTFSTDFLLFYMSLIIMFSRIFC
ncbi:protein artichoke [Sitophilus oryzae]|uniref:Protein artichoke n=1 Tax=Sitophilus oryzae TaxID=7048 RepID=A0A6J2Y8B7_SITOR|nr:protein artichoke [Sitophilus oryzae]